VRDTPQDSFFAGSNPARFDPANDTQNTGSWRYMGISIRHTHNYNTHTITTHTQLQHTHNYNTHTITTHTHNYNTHTITTHTHNYNTHTITTHTQSPDLQPLSIPPSYARSKHFSRVHIRVHFARCKCIGANVCVARALRHSKASLCANLRTTSPV